jgi:hypothetical protein
MRSVVGSVSASQKLLFTTVPSGLDGVVATQNSGSVMLLSRRPQHVGHASACTFHWYCTHSCVGAQYTTSSGFVAASHQLSAITVTTSPTMPLHKTVRLIVVGFMPHPYGQLTSLVHQYGPQGGVAEQFNIPLGFE